MLRHWASSFSGETASAIPPDLVEPLRAAIPRVLAEINRDREPTPPQEIVGFLAALAEDRRLDPPENELAQQLTIQALSRMPRGVWRQVCEEVWITWRYRRLPAAADLFGIAEKHGLGREVSNLLELKLKLDTLALREGVWAAEAERMRLAARQRAADHYFRSIEDLSTIENLLRPGRERPDKPDGQEMPPELLNLDLPGWVREMWTLARRLPNPKDCRTVRDILLYEELRRLGVPHDERMRRVPNQPRPKRRRQ